MADRRATDDQLTSPHKLIEDVNSLMTLLHRWAVPANLAKLTQRASENTSQRIKGVDDGEASYAAGNTWH